MTSFSRRGALAAVLPTLLLAACSTGPAGSTSTTGSGTSSTGTASTSGTTTAAAFPVTIEHAFGSTTIEKEPTRIATIGWSDQDHLVALGIVPVGATKLTWGGNAAGSSDWFDSALASLGGDAPVRYDDADGAPIEQIAALSPDLILATNSGLTQEDYDKLVKIAPVVAYPEAPWITPWRTSLATVGKAVGRSDKAAQLTAAAEQQITAATTEHANLTGTSLIFGYLTTADLGTVGVYAAQDPRVALMRDFGLVDAPAVAEVVKAGEFYGSVSAERAADLTSDVFLTWSENPSDMKTFEDNKLIGQIPAIKDGHAYAEADKPTALAVTNPTPLSIPVVIDKFIPKVAAAIGS